MDPDMIPSAVPDEADLPRRAAPGPAGTRAPGSIPGPAPAGADRLGRAARGEPAAVRALLDGVGPVVYGFVYARVGGREDVAEDLVQDTFLEAMRSAPGFR